MNAKDVMRAVCVTVAGMLTAQALAAAVQSATSAWINWDDQTNPWTVLSWGLLTVGACVAVWKFADYYEQLFSDRKDRRRRDRD